MPLIDKNKRALRALAHHKRPVVIVGNSGLSENVLNEIATALDHHQLIKLRVNADHRDARDLVIEAVCARLQAELVQRVGHVATLYRQNPERPSLLKS